MKPLAAALVLVLLTIAVGTADQDWTTPKHRSSSPPSVVAARVEKRRDPWRPQDVADDITGRPSAPAPAHDLMFNADEAQALTDLLNGMDADYVDGVWIAGRNGRDQAVGWPMRLRPRSQMPPWPVD